ncbi:vWA domain-containing protein [Paraliomyxa miuraensis]|uniref:vWA domain-containing protein n=1 Tax=Paraliomyxa miuraensis TaxID=376150 RepID=UPI002255727F|nr:vWA domain-containing protein [Paraliomyxa miuraensis]MCX4246861.1 VWA domain-containing protein [Paraliomyxa miuraensis]
MSTQWIGRLGLAVATVLAPALAACNSHPIKPTEYDNFQESEDDIPISVNRDVDILFVIDDSRSMAEEQATLARNFGPLLERLDRDDVRANYRIAITTTDDGHWLCGNGDEGAFQLSSCLGRADDFRTTIDGQSRDFFQEACAEICAYESIDVLPTTTFSDPTPRPRPWIESIDGVSNLPEGISPVDAFKCFAPQGVTGCGLEAPLETMRKGLTLTTDPTAPEFGFVRPGAILAVVIVTDEADCSSRWDEVRDPWDKNGSQALWTEENIAKGQLTSEVCWFGGVHCEESPDGTKECWAVDKAADGSETQDPSQAVLHPLDRYVDFLAKLEADKQVINPDQQLLVAVLTGVPSGYDGGAIPYTDGDDAEFLRENGIGAGCASDNGKAAPPVRLAELADAFRADDDDVNLYSVCEPDYSNAMSAIAAAIDQQVRPPCVPTCVGDSDLDREGLQPDCQLTEEYVTYEGDEISYSIPACLAVDGSWALPEGHDVCYRSLTDRDGSTPEDDDDMSPTCAEEGWNLELSLMRRNDASAPPGARVRARCSVSQLQAVDCPGLEG